MTDPSVRLKADDAFSQARRRVFFRRVLSFFTRHHEASLLSFEEVRDKLSIRGQRFIGTQTIPIAKIAGTAGRYQEFNRAFLPTQEFIRDRWKGVYEAAHAQGFPPIDVYKIGDVYFVRDGHHRVSVLKDLGATTIEATVTELETPISLSADIAEEDLDLKGEYAHFLAETDLNLARPEQNVEFTLPGQCPKLFEHIAGHRHFLGLREQREIPQSEAVVRWYDEVYAPVVQVIREERILEHFPERTEADLYLWLIEHRHYLTQRYGQEVPLEQAAAEFSREYGTGAGKKQLESEVKKAKGAAKKKGKPIGTIAVFGSGSAPSGHPVLAQAERMGQLLAEANFVLINGGYGGTMEAVSRGARQAGGKVIGVTMDLFAGKEPNPWLTKEKRVKDFFPRLRHLTSADGFVILEGGIGTLTELTLTWSLLQTGQIPSRPLVLVGASWHRMLATFQAETFMTEQDLRLVTIVNSAEDALSVLTETLAPAP